TANLTTPEIVRPSLATLLLRMLIARSIILLLRRGEVPRRVPARIHQLAEARGDAVLKRAPAARTDEPLVDLDLDAEVTGRGMPIAEPRPEPVGVAAVR